MLDGRGRLTLSIVSAAAAVLGLMLLEGAAGRCWVLGGCVGVAERRGAHILWQGLHFHLKSFSAMQILHDCGIDLLLIAEESNTHLPTQLWS